MATRVVIVLDENQRWWLDRADILGVAATGVEHAAGRRVGRAGNLARQHDPLLAYIRVGRWDGRDQRLGVGVQRVFQQRLRLGQLDDLANIHHRDSVTYVLDYRE